MFLVADASQREELAKQFLTRLPLTEDHAEWRVVLNAIELLIQQGNQEVRDRNKIEISEHFPPRNILQSPRNRMVTIFAIRFLRLWRTFLASSKKFSDISKFFELKLIEHFQVMAALPELSAHCLNSVNNLNLDIHCDKRTVLKIGEFIQKIHDSNQTLFGELKQKTPEKVWTKLNKAATA